MSYSRKRVSRGFFFPNCALDSCFRRNDEETRIQTEVDLSRHVFGTPRLEGEGVFSFSESFRGLYDRAPENYSYGKV